jgi:hypothetical protein
MLRSTFTCLAALTIVSGVPEHPARAAAPGAGMPAQVRTSAQAQESAQELVVMIESRLGDEDSVGAGIIFDKRVDSLYIVTANHVVRRGAMEAGDIRVRLKMLPGERFTARLLDSFTSQDLAVLRVDGLTKFERDLASLRLDRLGDANAVQARDEVYTIGQPNGKRWDVSVGGDLVTRVEGTAFAFRSLSVAPGSSGGALLNAQGLLIGLVQRDAPPAAEAIRIDVVTRVLKAGDYPVAWQAPSRAGDVRPDPPVAAAPKAAAGLPWRIVGTADFNSDGRTDILWHNRDTSHIQSWLLNSMKSVGRPEVDDEGGQRAVVGLPWSIVANGDFNGDRRTDILWHNRDTNHIQAWMLNGVRMIGRAEVDDERGQRAVVGLPWSIVASGDFNGDRKADILWHNRDTNHIQAWMLDGVRIVGRAEVDDERGQRAVVGLPWSIVAADDFNSDGNVDILWHNRDTNHIQAWFLNGVKIVGRAEVDDERGQPAAVGLPWRIVGTGDFNGDGRRDLLWHNADTDRVQAWLLNGLRIAGRPEVDN